MSILNADARLSQAVDILHTQTVNNLKERIVIAWTQALSRVAPEDLPPELRSEFEELVIRLTSKGTIQDTLAPMDDHDIDRIIRRVSGLAHAVEQEADRLSSDHR